MIVANLELCKELHELSGWGQTSAYYKQRGDGITINYITRQPAYDLGYLLRKLQPSLHEVKENAFRYDEFDYELQLQWQPEEKNWLCWYVFQHYKGEADTPEDAACKLCIELFKQGILK